MPTTDFPVVSIIIPCRNEVHYIEHFIASIRQQTYPMSKVEIIVADGQSNDGTREKLELIKQDVSNLVVIENPKKTTPQALNLAIKASSGSFIVRMDCHAIYPKNYVETLIQASIDLHAENVGVPLITVPHDDSLKSLAIATALSSKVAVGSSQFRTSSPDQPLLVDTVPFGCFPKSVFTKIGLYSELLIRNQDDELNNRIRINGGSIYLLPTPKVEYFARSTFKSLGKMYYQYGLYKPLSNKVSGKISSLRQLAPLVFQALLVTLTMIALLTGNSIFWLLLSLTLISYLLILLSAGMIELKKKVHRSLFLGAVLYTYAVVLMHHSYGFGYGKGLIYLLMGKTDLDKSLSR